MKKTVLFLIITLFLYAVAHATQVPAAPPKDELVQAWLDTVKIAAQFANTECQQLESVKQFNKLRADTQQKIETKLPGYTVNWSQFAIVAKPVAAATK